MKEPLEEISVVGLGYVGLPLALLADKKGYKVIGIDSNSSKIEMLKAKNMPFVDEKNQKMLVESNIEATTDFSKIKNSSVVIVCVPTPVYENHMPNLEPVKNASVGIAKHLQKGQLVILESTVNPGVCEDVVLPILEEGSKLKGGKDFYLAHCPERINPGDKKWDVENIPRVVGSLEQKGLRKALNFYKSVLISQIKPMDSLKEAEAVKIVENSFRDINIAFVNELAQSFSRLGIDVVKVIDGAATKPFAFLAHYPGCGVGGHCIPVDPYYLIEYAKQNGFHHDFLSWARRVNNSMPHFTVDRLISALNQKKIAINGSKIALLGLSYKADIDDCRESPSFKIIEYLEEVGAKVSTFDPFNLDLSSAKSLDEALKGAKAVVIATAHTLFKELKPTELKEKNIDVLVDGRNCLSKEMFRQAGITYSGIGR